MPTAPTTSFSTSRFRIGRVATHLRAELARARQAFIAFQRLRARSKQSAIPAWIDNPWQRYWGESYGPDLKRWLLKPVFEDLEIADRLGDLIVDVGSGAMPVTGLLKARPGRKRILVDIAADNTRSADEQKIRLDVGKVCQPDALSWRKAVVRACGFLQIHAKAECQELVDTFVFSDVLNYVDFRNVLNGFSEFLKPGGRIIVTNLPFRGNRSLFSDKGLKDNRELYQFLEEHQFEIEHKSFPCRPRGETDESEELIVLVARKGDPHCMEPLI